MKCQQKLYWCTELNGTFHSWKPISGEALFVCVLQEETGSLTSKSLGERTPALALGRVVIYVYARVTTFPVEKAG